MYEFFKNILEKNTCRSIGVCSVHPSVNALYEILLSQLRETSFYLVKLKEFNLLNISAMDKIIESLSIFLINTSFNKTKYLNLIKELSLLKESVKKKYEEHCSTYQFPCEIINSNLKIDNNTSLSDLVEIAQNYIVNKQKNNNQNKQHMFDLITLLAKLSAINVIKIKKINNDIQEKLEKYTFEIIRFFSLTNGYSIRNEKIKRRILEFCNTAQEIKKELNKTLEEKYGKKENCSVETTILKGHNILISGDDINELEKVLKTIDEIEIDNEIKEKINVYTNGALFLSHFYPFFKNNKFLKGHLGTNNTEYDFSTFQGSILITQNFVQKIDNLYRGEIFSNKLISFEGIQDIIQDNYIPLIDSCLKIENQIYNKKAPISFNCDFIETKEKIKNFNKKEVILIIGQIDDDNIFTHGKKDEIINLDCPLELDEIFNFIEILKEKEIKITILFTQCNLSNIELVLLLLNKEISIYLASCSNILINPHIIETLKKDFDVNFVD